MSHAAVYPFRLAGVLIALALFGCGQQEKPVQLVEPTRATVCALDGMTLLDYPGPKAQIHYQGGEVEFHCDTTEMMSIVLRPEQKKRILAVFTQDMGKANWDKPEGYWIDATKAFYVRGSKRHGSMGPTLATFASKAEAEVFAKQNGGKVLTFGEIKPEMISIDGGVLHDQHM